MEKLMHVPSEKENLRTEKQSSSKCPVYRKVTILEQGLGQGLPHISLGKFAYGFWRSEKEMTWVGLN